MSKNKYIIIVLFLFIVPDCTPTINTRQKSNITRNVNSSFKDETFSWPSNDYEDLNFLADNKDKSNEKINSKKSIASNNDMSLERIIKTYKPENNKKIYKDKDQFKLKSYQIEKGDNLLKISNKFNVSVNEIIKINKIKNSNKIYEGMIIKIPSNGAVNKFNTENNSHNNGQIKPPFIWPIKDVYATKRDGLDGVKSIGIIITCKPGTIVLSSADGIVTKVGHMRGFGNYIILKHINKYLTIYSNLKEINVNEGDIIKSGKIIGRLEGNKLHFQIGHAGRPEDPLFYLSRKG